MLNRLTIKTKLRLLAGVPTFILLVLTLMNVTRLTTEIQNAHHAQTIAALVVALGEVTHELQKERGLSAGFLASRGAKFADRLPAQRTTSATKIVALRTTLNAVDLTGTAPDYRGALLAALDDLERLTAVRARIDQFSVLPPESFHIYSDAIAKLLDVAMRSSNELPNAHLARLANTKSALLYFKERIGQERAMLSGALSAGQITAPQYEMLLTLLSDQTNFQRLTLALATPEQRAALNQALDHPSVKEVAQVEQMVRSVGVGTALNYPPELWFDQITVKIDRLRSVEEQFSQAITATVTQHTQQARTMLIAFWC